MHLFTAATRPTGQVGVGFFCHDIITTYYVKLVPPKAACNMTEKKVPGIAKYCQGCKVLDEEVVQLARAGLGDR